MTVTLISHTPQPEQIIAAAAKLCYSDTTVEDLMDGLSAEQAEKFVGMLETMGHESPVEHVPLHLALLAFPVRCWHRLPVTGLLHFPCRVNAMCGRISLPM